MIRSLPRDVVDRIAAGEVVERPASVVKELVENALDAGARRISVEIEGGGLGLIRVVDDGHGLSPTDLPLAFAPHATSKLHDVADLAHIASFGFRGEALCSIAAVSRARIVSRTRGAAAGAALECAAGRLGSVQPAAGAPGTTVEIRDLFHNVPARRSFLASERAEAARCRDTCAALALAVPELHLRFRSDGREQVLGNGAASLDERIAGQLGADFLAETVPLSARGEGLVLEGRLTLPAAARPRPSTQQLFVNQRVVRDRALSAAVRSGCRDFLPGTLQPAWVLSLEVDPARVDVNVHPTKAEVRFRDADAVFALVRSACRRALLGADLAPRVRAEHFGAGGSPLERPQAAGRVSLVSRSETTVAGEHAVPPGAASGGAGTVTEDSALVAVLRQDAGPGFRAARRCLQILDTYLVHDSPEGLVLIDQHALHERVLYARLQRELAEGRVASQQLLLPEPLHLPPLLAARALELAPELARFGLVLESFGPETVAVRAVPVVLRGESLADLVAALVDPPELHGGLPGGLDRRLFTMACHAAVKAGDPLGEAEIEELLAQGEALEHDATCPHGRPTRLLVSPTELERLFKRSGF